MSVIVTVWVRGDPKKVEQVAGEGPDRMTEILEQAKDNGLIAHRFYGSDDTGQIMVIDEWPDAESFQRFFDGAMDKIGPLMGDAGITDQPQPNFWRKLETHDEYGWES
jgi:hypothetical protein